MNPDSNFNSNDMCLNCDNFLAKCNCPKNLCNNCKNSYANCQCNVYMPSSFSNPESHPNEDPELRKTIGNTVAYPSDMLPNPELIHSNEEFTEIDSR